MATTLQPPPPCSASSAPEVERERVAGHHHGSDRLDHVPQDGDQVVVRLDRQHQRARLGQRQGQGPEPRADLEDARPGAHSGQSGDAPDSVGVGDEVLPEGPVRPEAVCCQQLGDVGAGKGHQEIVTSTTPSPRSAIWANPSGDMSTTRGYPAPSRSSTVHVVDASVASLVTVSTVPNGSDGLAHMPAGAAEYHVASPTSE